jgi:hypothetical protein
MSNYINEEPELDVIICQTSLYILKKLKGYFELFYILYPISFDVFIALKTLFSYLIYSFYQIFTTIQ